MPGIGRKPSQGHAGRPRYALLFIAGLVAVAYRRLVSGAPSAGVSGSGFRLRGGWPRGTRLSVPVGRCSRARHAKVASGLRTPGPAL